jgi:hypothetical protein
LFGLSGLSVARTIDFKNAEAAGRLVGTFLIPFVLLIVGLKLFQSKPVIEPTDTRDGSGKDDRDEVQASLDE